MTPTFPPTVAEYRPLEWFTADDGDMAHLLGPPEVEIPMRLGDEFRAEVRGYASARASLCERVLTFNWHLVATPEQRCERCWSLAR